MNLGFKTNIKVQILHDPTLPELLGFELAPLTFCGILELAE